MGFFREFREFASRGNVVDLAVGLVLGAAFQAIVRAFVDELLMPPIAHFLVGKDLESMFWVVGGGDHATREAAEAAGAAVIGYGVLLARAIDFLIVAFALFLLVRGMNRLRRRQETGEAPSPPPSTKECPYCLSTIAIAASRCPNCTSDVPGGRARG